MTHSKVHTRLVLAAATVLGAAALASTPAAVAAPMGPTGVQALRISGDMEIAPGVHVLNIEAIGARGAGGQTMGRYEATVLDGRNPTPIHVRGPITCIYTQGGTASLVYPITGTTPEVLPAAARGAAAVQITVRKGVRGAPDHVGVMGPMATSAFKGCQPAMTPFVFDGEIDIR
ncbi:hypothetical protein [Gordonia insulae]|uniref:Allene oxide cyclase barrel-like domain-containing protein n=1 Tax=Gordonia insulae TaxID=2420509 RepID=A0A3G8JUW6_9ACTN|nr:hypothetical protein [Gordonia insulae]AZG48676.1 hypothetical protein D7316_05296 [Gordonia insulae]